MKIFEETDIAFELPTGTGKTAVGLLIGEWKRKRTGKRVAYLTLTNQLATQVLREAQSLGIQQFGPWVTPRPPGDRDVCRVRDTDPTRRSPQSRSWTPDGIPTEYRAYRPTRGTCPGPSGPR